MITEKDKNYYVNLDWSFSIDQETDDGVKLYIISVNELPGVCTDAATIEEGMQDIREVLEATIELYLKQGDEIPEPIKKEKYKGKIAYRTTRERHFSLAKLAQRKRISMNKALDMVFDIGIQQFHL
jgi:predicted RNase H-like HicB family nuclease